MILCLNRAIKIQKIWNIWTNGTGTLNTLTRDTLNGLVTGIVMGQTNDTLTYNSFGELMSVTSKYSSTTQGVQTLTRDNLGRIVTKDETLPTTGLKQWAYSYNSRGQLTGATLGGSAYSSYTYDSSGNRTSATVNGVSDSATYDDQDRLIQYNVYTYSYDDAGRLVSKTNNITNDVTTYNYDFFGHLLGVTLPNGTVITYVNNVEGLRLRKIVNGVVTKRYAYSTRGQLIAELLPNGNIDKRFFYSSKSNVPDSYRTYPGGVHYRIISDHLGSPRYITTVATSASITYRMEHDEFGRVMVDTSPGLIPFGFAGGIYDPDTGLVRFGARDYDPYTGRWTAKDPIIFEGGDANLYGYVLQDPVNKIDPKGKSWAAVAALAVGSAALAYVGHELYKYFRDHPED